MSSVNDYTEQLRKALHGQLAPPSSEGHDTRILFRCATCNRVWLRSGPTSKPRLSQAEIETLAQELHANLDDLPTATCSICSATLAGMEIELDGYHDQAGKLWGVGLSYEAVDPPGAHLLVTAHNLAWLENVRKIPRSGVIVDFERTRRFLVWLTKLSYPAAGYKPITPAESVIMARDNKPGHGAPDTADWSWKGASWVLPIPAFEGRSVLTVGQAMPPGEPYSLSGTIALARVLAQIVLQGRIAGEPE